MCWTVLGLEAVLGFFYYNHGGFWSRSTSRERAVAVKRVANLGLALLLATSVSATIVSAATTAPDSLPIVLPFGVVIASVFVAVGFVHHLTRTKHEWLA